MITRSSVAWLLLAASWIACSDSGPASRSTETAPETKAPSIVAPATLAEDELWKPVRRFVPERTSASLPPEATIRDETRPALWAFDVATLNYSAERPVSDDGRVLFNPALPKSMQAQQVFLSIRVRPDDRWMTLPGQLVSPYRELGRQRVDVRFELSGAAGRTTGVWVQAIAPHPPGATSIRSDAVPIPPRARLDFAIGALEPAWGAGPVDFVIDACEGTDDRRCTPLFRKRFDPASQGAQGFLDHTLGLQQLAGRRVSLEFAARPVGSADARSLPFFADPVLLAPAVRDPADRNLILISLDTLRSDHVSAYGYELETTPFLDELAGRGVLFENYVAASSSTRPSHMTMFTSLQPSVHGTTENRGIRALPLGVTTLAERMQEAGVATGAFTENGAIDRSRGFGRGFDVYLEDRDASRADLRTGHIEQIFANGLAWLDGVRDRRFFLFLHTYQVHNPFTPPPEYAHFFANDPVEHPPELRADWDPRLYDREIRYADDRVRALVDELHERGLLENTYIVVTSDHGEAFLEHGFVAHGASVHHEVLNVPLIVTGPDVAAGRRVPTPVPMVDLMPTVLELMGVAQGGAEMGRSQAAIIRGASEANLEPRAIYSEAWAERAYRGRGFDRIPQPTLALRLGDRKIVRARVSERNEDGHRYELYDLATDPREETDLFPESGASAADLQDLLRRYDATVKVLHDQLEESGDAGALDPDLEEKLRALGYLE